MALIGPSCPCNNWPDRGSSISSHPVRRVWKWGYCSKDDKMSVFSIKTLSMSLGEKIKKDLRRNSDHLDSACCVLACRDALGCCFPFSLVLRYTSIQFMQCWMPQPESRRTLGSCLWTLGTQHPGHAKSEHVEFTFKPLNSGRSPECSISILKLVVSCYHVPPTLAKMCKIVLQ